MNEETFNELIMEAIDIRFLIVKAGGMATKSIVENVLMLRHQIERLDAHDIMNHIENCRVDQDYFRGSIWQAKHKNEPAASDYPEISRMV